MLFARSTWPLALGWATEAYLTEMHRSSQKSQKVMANKSSSEVGDDVVRETESVDDIFEELDCFLCSSRDERFILNPLGELINGDIHVLETTCTGLKGPIISSP